MDPQLGKSPSTIGEGDDDPWMLKLVIPSEAPLDFRFNPARLNEPPPLYAASSSSSSSATAHNLRQQNVGARAEQQQSKMPSMGDDMRMAVPAIDANATTAAPGSALVRRSGKMGPLDVPQRQSLSFGPQHGHVRTVKPRSRGDVELLAEHQQKQQKRRPVGPPMQRQQTGGLEPSGNRAVPERRTAATPRTNTAHAPTGREEHGRLGTAPEDLVIVLDDENHGATHNETQPSESNKGRAARPPHGNPKAHRRRTPRGISGVTPTGPPLPREHPAIGYSLAQKPEDGLLGGSGGIINRAINELMSQNLIFEKRIGELESALMSQRKETEAAEAKVSELTGNAETHAKRKADVLSRLCTLEKFVRTLGEDFNTLNTRNLDLKNRSNEALVEKAAIRSELEEVRAQVELERLGRERTDFRGRADALHGEINTLRNFHTFQEAALGEKTGLLVEARDRIQTLETTVQDLQRAFVDRRLESDEFKNLIIGLHATTNSKIEGGNGINTESLAECVEGVRNLQSLGGDLSVRLFAMKCSLKEASEHIVSELRKGQKTHVTEMPDAVRLHIERSADYLAQSFATSMANLSQDFTHILSSELGNRFDSILGVLDRNFHIMEAIPGDVSSAVRTHALSAADSLKDLSASLEAKMGESIRAIEGKVGFAMAKTVNDIQHFYNQMAQRLQSAGIELIRTVRREMETTSQTIYQKLESDGLSETISDMVARKLASAMVSPATQLLNGVCKTTMDKVELVLKNLDSIIAAMPSKLSQPANSEEKISAVVATVLDIQKSIRSLADATRDSWVQWSDALKTTYELRLQESEARHEVTEQRRLESEAQCSKLLEQIACQNHESQKKQLRISEDREEAAVPGQRGSPAESTIRVTLGALKQEVWHKETQLQTLRAEKLLLEDKIDQMAVERKEVEENGHAHRAQLREKLQSRIDSLELQKENHDQAQDLRMQLDSKEATLRDLLSENSDLHTKLETSRADFQHLSFVIKEKEALLLEKEDQVQDLERLEERLEEEERKIASHLETIRSIDKDRMKTLQEKEVLEAQIESLQQENSELLQRTTALENSNKQLEADIRECKGKVQTLQERLAGVGHRTREVEATGKAGTKSEDHGFAFNVPAPETPPRVGILSTSPSTASHNTAIGTFSRLNMGGTPADTSPGDRITLPEIQGILDRIEVVNEGSGATDGVVPRTPPRRQQVEVPPRPEKRAATTAPEPSTKKRRKETAGGRTQSPPAAPKRATRRMNRQSTPKQQTQVSKSTAKQQVQAPKLTAKRRSGRNAPRTLLSSSSSSAADAAPNDPSSNSKAGQVQHQLEDATPAGVQTFADPASVPGTPKTPASGEIP